MSQSDLQRLSEVIQQDITFYLDGEEPLVIENICDIIVKRFEQEEISSVNIAALNHNLSNYFNSNV